MTQTLHLCPQTPEQLREAAAQAAGSVAEGKLVAFPTETVYGIAVDASNAKALGRLRELKDRPDRPFSVHLPGPEALAQYVREIPDEAARLMQRAWPGPVTLILPAADGLARQDWNRPEIVQALCWEGSIGLRCPDAPGSIELLKRVDAPVVAPSANLAGQASPRSGQEVLERLDGKVDLLLDTGPTRLGTDSTIVRIQPGRVDVLRESAVPTDQIERMITRRYLFVCTGNTCRSPMASGIARALLAQKLGVRVSQLSDRRIEVRSAGVTAGSGAPATEHAVAAAGTQGADISAHRSEPLTRDRIRQADVVFCMTRDHVEMASGLAPEHAAKIRVLDRERDIVDPIGAGRQMYQQTAEQIAAAIRNLLDEGTI